MDDYLDSFDNLDEAITTVHDVTPFLTFGSFNLATFISSNRITLKNLSREILLSKWRITHIQGASKNLGRNNRYA